MITRASRGFLREDRVEVLIDPSTHIRRKLSQPRHERLASPQRKDGTRIMSAAIREREQSQHLGNLVPNVLLSGRASHSVTRSPTTNRYVRSSATLTFDHNRELKSVLHDAPPRRC
jgi:hypothetical protein